MSIHQIIQSIADIGSTKTKQSILEANKSNEVLKNVFLYTENPRFNFYIKVVPSGGGFGVDDITMSTFKQLDKLINREYTGNAARRFVDGMLAMLTPEAQTVLIRIINRDLRCNCGTSIANKVWKDLIPEYPVMLASKGDAKNMEFLRKHKGPYIVQKKCDGGRVNVHVDSTGNVTYRSRNGSTLELFGRFDSQFNKFFDCVFDGELLVRTKDGIADRKVGNGLYTKAVRDTLSKEECDKFCMEIWDGIPSAVFNGTEKSLPYKDRLTHLQITNYDKDLVVVVESKEVETIDDCFDFYADMRNQGEEGAIIKTPDSLWEDRRSKYMVKMKASETADLMCVDWEPGKPGTKYAKMIGSLILQTSDGLLEVGCGTGLVDEDRARDPKYYLGRVIEVGYNEVITSKDPNKKTKSLFLPVYKQVRFDKNVANKLSELA